MSENEPIEENEWYKDPENMPMQKLKDMGYTALMMKTKLTGQCVSQVMVSTRRNIRKLFELKAGQVRELCDEDVDMLVKLAHLGFCSMVSDTFDSRLFQRLAMEASDISEENDGRSF